MFYCFIQLKHHATQICARTVFILLFLRQKCSFTDTNILKLIAEEGFGDTARV